MKLMKSNDIELLYKPVIEKLIAGNIRLFEVYRYQFATIKVEDIKEDGYGFFVDLKIDPSTKIVTPQATPGPISSLTGVNKEGEIVCGFALFADHGQINLLDGYPLGRTSWPEEEIFLAYPIYKENGTVEYSESRSLESLEEYKIKEDIITADGHVWKYDPDHE